MLWKADLENGKYKNPILFADYSDPDVIRVGDTYYMTASSFNYIPGLPILISKDLVNWELVGYALSAINYPGYEIPQHSKGVWAPAIRYHEGMFYIYYGMPDEGIFMVRTANPLGKWEEPVCVLPGKGLIDSCPFWDEDGNAYVIHGYAKSRIGFKSVLGIFPMSWDGTRAIGEDHILYNGVKTNPTIEGPKVFKRDGMYYILAPAGGVRTGWQVALRSKSIYGPYEETIVLEKGSSPTNGPHQGGLVDTVNGDEWFIHFQDRGFYGRIIHLQPVHWVDGWPVMGEPLAEGSKLVLGTAEQAGANTEQPDRPYSGQAVVEYEKPNTGVVCEPIYLDATDEFDGTAGLQWQWMGNPPAGSASLGDRVGFLRLFAKNPSKKAEPVIWESANVLTQKLVCPFFSAETKLYPSGRNYRTGLVMMGGEYAFCELKRDDDSLQLVYGTSTSQKDGSKVETIEVLADLTQDADKIRETGLTIGLSLKDAGDGSPSFEFTYSVDGADAVAIASSRDFVPSDHTWVGAKMGIYCIANGAESDASCSDFEYFRVEANES